MASTIATLRALLTLDDSDFLKGLDSAAQATSGGFLSNLSKVGGAVVATGIGAVGAAIAGTAGILTVAAGEAMAAEEVQSKLNATLKNTGPITGVSVDMVNELANRYQNLTRFEDDSIVAGGDVLAGFKEINSTVFPDALSLSLDLATRLGTDVPDAASLLGKALADPGVGLMRLKQAGVVFSDEQEKMIKTMTEAGDVAGAQALIMDVVRQSVGGAAEAAGQTAAGTWDRLHNQWKNILETLGTGLLPAIAKLGEMLMTYLNRPEVQAFVAMLAQKIAEFAMTVVNNIPVVITWFQQAFTFLQNNQGIVIAILAALGVAVAAFVYSTVLPALGALIVGFAPVLLVMLAVGAAAYLLYQAWTNNWGGIQEKTAAVIAWITNAFNSVVAVLTAIWNNPVIQLAVQTLLTNIRLIVGAFQAAFSGDWTRFGELLRMAWDNAWRMIGIILQVAITKFRTINWGEVGRSILEGIAAGIRAGATLIAAAAKSAAQAALDAAKGFLGIHSPSEVFELQVGFQMAAGVARGWERGLAALLPPSVAQLQPSPAAVSTETGSTGGLSDALLLDEVRRLLRNLPAENARMIKAAIEKASVGK